MSNTVGSLDVIKAARAQIPTLEAELQRIEQARHTHRKDVAAVKREVHAAWEYLATVLVPDLQPAHLAWGSQLLSLPPLAPDAVQAAMAAERAELDREIALVDAAPEYVRREAILNECSIQLVELDEAIAPLRAAQAAFDGVPQWDELVASGYGTDAYTGKWWTMSYYRHWKHGDQAVATIGAPLGLKTFAEVRARWEEERRALAQLEGSRGEVDGRRRVVESLVSRRAAYTDRLHHQDARTLSRLRGLVTEHLMALPRRDIATMLADYAPGLVAIKRVAGLEAKAGYLEQTFAQWVDGPEAALRKALRKAQRDVVKLARPKNFHRRFPRADYERRFADRSDKWGQRWDRYRDSRQHLLQFDAYDRYTFEDATPWWSVMTEDRIKARFIPEVAQYYQQQRHSGSSSRDDHDAAVAALAFADARDDGPGDDFDMS